MPPALVGVAVLAFAAFAPAAEAAGPLEIDLLEAYLATRDAAPGLPHCARTSGYAVAPGVGLLGASGAATNGILREHVEFHAQMGDGPRGHVPSTDDADRYGEIFLEWHEYLLGVYQAWRAAHGHPPLAGWDPATPMPPELAYPYPERACTDGRDEDPGVPLPTWATLEGGDEPDPLFGHTSLCDFRDRNQLGKSLAGPAWHRPFHAGVGGEMTALHGPRDPAFWAGHQFLIDLTDTFERACADGEPALAPSADAPLRPAPAPGLAALLAGLALVGAAAKGFRPSEGSRGAWRRCRTSRSSR